MSGPQFFQTRMGQKYFESTAPRIADALENIAKELKRQNDQKEAEAPKVCQCEPNGYMQIDPSGICPDCKGTCSTP